METRRSFVTFLFLSGIYSGLVGDPIQAQNPTSRPIPPVPGSGDNSGENPPGLANPDKKILENNDKDMKKKVEQLYQLASQLKAEVEKTDSSKVLSLDLVRKAEEIEKLAHDIKNRSKG
jgi:hypothetical protein